MSTSNVPDTWNAELPQIDYVSPPRVQLAHLPSPLESLERLTRDLGGPPLLMKRDDMTGIELTGNKSRKLEYVLADARARGFDSLLTWGGLQSNHCRATASLGAKVGMPTRIVIRGDIPPDGIEGNLFLDYLFGADVTHVETKDFVARKQYWLDRAMEEEKTKGRNPYFFPVGASIPVAVWAYVRCLREIVEQAAERGLEIRHVVCACGSGGTVAGLILGRALLRLQRLKVWGVAVTMTEQFWVQDIRKLLRETCAEYKLALSDEHLPIRVLDRFVGPGYAISYPEEIEVISRVARLEGIALDPVYTGKAMTGLVDLVRRGEIAPGEPVVFVHTGGIFGLFPYRQEFKFPVSG